MTKWRRRIKQYWLAPGITNGELEETSVEPVSLYDVAVKPYERKKFFKDTRLGRFVSLRTKASKTIFGALVGVGSNMLPGPIGGWVDKAANLLITTQTGVPMEIFEGLSLLQVGIVIGSFLIVTGIPLLFKGIRNKAIWKVVKGRVDAVSDAVVESVDKESEGGKKITRSELKDIIEAAIKGESDESPS